MHNDCPSEGRIVDFAISPLLEENGEIALHILHCGKCAGKLAQINHVLLSESEVSPAEWTEIKHFVARLKTKDAGDLWVKIERLLTSFKLEPAGIPAEPEERLFAAASQKQFQGGNEKAKASGLSVDLIFEANCDAACVLYWKAVLRIALSAGDDTLLPIFITDGKGVPVSEGTLALCGQKLPVTNGKSAISLGIFRRGLNTREVAFHFVSGKDMNGSLIFALEDLK